MDIDWKLLIGVRERRQQSAQEAVARERRATEAREAQARQVEGQWQRQVAAKAQHEQALRAAFGSGACKVAQLQQAGAWHGALDSRIAQEARALSQAQAQVADQRRLLAASLQRLRNTRVGLAKAQRIQQRVKAQCRDLQVLRLEDAVEEAAVQRWAARRAA